jgi:hypothetical protein
MKKELEHIMTKSLDEKFPYPLDLIIYDHFPSDSLDYREVKTLGTILWIIKWSNGVNEVDCFEIAKRAIANYGRVFDYSEREVAWATIRLLEKGILSSIFMGPAEDLPSISSSIVPAIKTVKVNSEELVSDALDYDVEKSTILVRSDHPSYLKAQNLQLYNNMPSQDKRSINNANTKQSNHFSSRERCKN